MPNQWIILKKILIKRGKERGFKTLFAEKLGVVPQAVQRYFSEDDPTIPSIDQAEKFAEIVGLDLKLLDPANAAGSPSEEALRLAILGHLVVELSTLKKDELSAAADHLAALGLIDGASDTSEAQKVRKG